MPFPKQLLNEGEEIVLYRHPHWTYLLSGLFMVGIAVVVMVVLFVVYPALWFVGLIILALAVVGAIGNYLRWRTIEFAVTTDRLIVRQGVLAKQGIEIPLDQIMNMSHRQSLYERMLGTGDLVVESAGENGRQQFTDVSNPAYVQNIMYRQRELYIQGKSGSVRAEDDDGVPADDIGKKLQRLADLRDNGVLSEEEFRQTKQNLLDRM